MTSTLQARKAKADARRAAGLCPICGVSADAGFTLCADHRQRERVRQTRNWPNRTPEAIARAEENRKKAYWTRVEQGVCVRCARPTTEGGTRWCAGCLAHLKARRLADPERLKERSRERRRALRQRVLDHYGGACACCGETTFEFLCIDHKYGGGGGHRRQEPRAQDLTRWVARNKFPPHFRVLCHNCNTALGLYGECPHGGVAPVARGSEFDYFSRAHKEVA